VNESSGHEWAWRRTWLKVSKYGVICALILFRVSESEFALIDAFVCPSQDSSIVHFT
jgi:hypothetical protein